jgi:hypothetical protein
LCPRLNACSHKHRGAARLDAELELFDALSQEDRDAAAAAAARLP